jgi:hypothetical protein
MLSGGRVEKMIPLRRLTTIVMPHRGPRASLRTQKSIPTGQAEKTIAVEGVSRFRSMSAIQILKYGLKENLWKKKGWLFDLLHREGIVDGAMKANESMSLTPASQVQVHRINNNFFTSIFYSKTPNLSKNKF